MNMRAVAWVARTQHFGRSKAPATRLEGCHVTIPCSGRLAIDHVDVGGHARIVTRVRTMGATGNLGNRKTELLCEREQSVQQALIQRNSSAGCTVIVAALGALSSRSVGNILLSGGLIVYP